MAIVPHGRPFGVVYYIRCSCSDAVYVGITTRLLKRRWSHHTWLLRNNQHHNPHLQNAWNKYGADAFSIDTVEACASQDDLNAAECRHIAQLRSIGASIYNQKDGGGYGGAMSAESRAKLSAMRRGKPRSDATRQNMSRARRGVPLNLTDARRDELRERVARNIHSPEARERGRLAKIGKTRNPEAVAHSRNTKLDRHGNTYHLTGPDGACYVTRDLVRFCETHGIVYRSLRNVLMGTVKNYRGWTGWIERKSE